MPFGRKPLDRYWDAAEFLCRNAADLVAAIGADRWDVMVKALLAAKPGSPQWREAIAVVHGAAIEASIPGGLGLGATMGGGFPPPEAERATGWRLPGWSLPTRRAARGRPGYSGLRAVRRTHAPSPVIRAVSFLADLQSRIPDRWYFRRLLPAAVYVVMVVICGGQLGWSHWDDLSLARARLAAGLRVNGSSAPPAIASLILFAVAIAICAFAVPVAAAAVDALASGAWPWFLAPLGSCVLKARQRWTSPEERKKKAVGLRGRGGAWREAYAVRLDRLVAAAPTQPKRYTWSADRFETARRNIERRTGQEISERWD